MTIVESSKRVFKLLIFKFLSTTTNNDDIIPYRGKYSVRETFLGEICFLLEKNVKDHLQQIQKGLECVLGEAEIGQSRRVKYLKRDTLGMLGSHPVSVVKKMVYKDPQDLNIDPSELLNEMVEVLKPDSKFMTDKITLDWIENLIRTVKETSSGLRQYLINHPNQRGGPGRGLMKSIRLGTYDDLRVEKRGRRKNNVKNDFFNNPSNMNQIFIRLVMNLFENDNLLMDFISKIPYIIQSYREVNSAQKLDPFFRYVLDDLKKVTLMPMHRFTKIQIVKEFLYLILNISGGNKEATKRQSLVSRIAKLIKYIFDGDVYPHVFFQDENNRDAFKTFMCFCARIVFAFREIGSLTMAEYADKVQNSKKGIQIQLQSVFEIYFGNTNSMAVPESNDESKLIEWWKLNVKLEDQGQRKRHKVTEASDLEQRRDPPSVSINYVLPMTNTFQGSFNDVKLVLELLRQDNPQFSNIESVEITSQGNAFKHVSKEFQ